MKSNKDTALVASNKGTVFRQSLFLAVIELTWQLRFVKAY
ncbi:hypothetical protein JOC76_002180 [Neobacillus cucumis]|nr:hypothetical protein [Neobacillus cucumis]